MSVVEKGKKNHLNCLIFFIKRVDTLQEREKKIKVRMIAK
jgi:hypothetical protein